MTKTFEEEIHKNGGECFEMIKNGKTFYEIQGLTSSPLKIFRDWQPPQALPVVPECVAEYIKQSKGFLSFYGALFGIFNETDTELHEWVKGKRKLEVFARAWLDGYTVEKTQLFYLREKNTNYYTEMKGAAMSEVTEMEVVKHITNSLNEMYIKGYADGLNAKPQFTIPKSIADELEEEIEEAYSNDYIRSYSDVGAYMEVITDDLDEDSELYKFMFPANDALLGCSHRNIIYLYLVDNDLVRVV